MEHKQQTAVEQLMTDLDSIKFEKREDWVQKRKEVFYKAKELEKKQLANAFYAPTDIQIPKNFEDYYNETYGK